MPLIAAVLLLALPWLNPFAPGPTPAVPTLLFSWTCAALFLLGCAVVRFRAGSLPRVAAAAWLVAALLSAFIGVLQYFGGTEGFNGWVNGTSVGEAFGNLRQRNQFATLTNMGLIALLWWTLSGHAQEGVVAGALKQAHSTWVTFLAVGSAALLAAGNAASSSRTGLAQLLMVLVIGGAWGHQHVRVRAVLVCAGLSYGLAAFFFPVMAGLDANSTGILSRLHESNAACAGRLTLWANVLHLIAQKPGFGWGWGELDYAHFITLYPDERFCDILDNAHNLPLHLAVELGVPFATIACAVGLWLVLRGKPWREADPTRQMAWAVLAVIGLHSLLEYPLWYGPFQIAAGLCVGLLWRNPCTASVARQNFKGFRPIATVWTACIASVLIASCAYAAWDYWRVSQLYLLPAQRSSIYRDNTLDKLRGSWLFKNQVQFAELTTTPTTAHNAAQLLEQALQLLHFSPEPRVVEKLIESAALLGRDDDAVYYLERYRAAFPEAHAHWAAESSGHKTP